MSGFTTHVLPPAAAGLAVALAATSLTGVLTGPHWWGFVVLTTAVVVVAGMLLRWLRMPSIVVAVGQLTALAGLVTVMFTSSGRLVVLPGPAAAAQLRALLARTAQQIRVGVPPVPESAGLLCLVVVAIGLVAVAVDTLTVSAAAPASSGLVLLGVVTVPAAVSEQLLPWWSFALSALGFALLLAVDSRRRQLTWGESAGSGGHIGAAPTAVAVTAGAVVVALLVGATVTAVGAGRSAGTSQPGSGIGLSPFTSLRGQLTSGDVVTLFRVWGLRQRAYLRALTLSRFTTGLGWQRGALDGAVPAGDERTERLPLPVGVSTPVQGSALQVRIEPINYVDDWLPSFGYPLALAGISPDWNYDPDAITVFSNHRQHAQPYTELGVLPAPDPQLLRAAGPAGGAPFMAVDPRYLDTAGVDQRVRRLATQVTAGTSTAFDATVALNRWFTQPSNGFRYDLRTAPGNSGDALVDFLFTGRRGYCEQFASAMAIMLRTLRVPARVAVGFTPGTVTGGSRLITTDDAHAWVEAWFPGAGWLPFDPTPLSNGRTVMPDYVAAGPTPAGSPPPAGPPVAGTATSMPDAAAPHPSVAARASGAGSGVGTRIGLSVAGLLGLGVLAGLTPLGVRAGRRRRRLHLVDAGGPRAVRAAWEEVLAESADRGEVPPVGETVRASAQRLVHAHALDEPGRAGLSIVVDAVERSWYAGVDGPVPSARVTDRELRAAVDAVRAGLARCAPPSRMSRLLPRSVLRTGRNALRSRVRRR
ncbi:MAG: transglutaminase domain-containing protein [Pseudonocardiales bacterium]|nr:transglutaminase domain-containing protein [Pseudonocardiales bacterium]MBV9030058.1 transglutaminase domain-containing protein [Pseudonocardiales bacterium]